jgi:hypothetical protein
MTRAVRASMLQGNFVGWRDAAHAARAAAVQRGTDQATPRQPNPPNAAARLSQLRTCVERQLDLHLAADARDGAAADPDRACE